MKNNNHNIHYVQNSYDEQNLLLAFIGVLVGTIMLIYEINGYPLWVDRTINVMIVLIIPIVYVAIPMYLERKK